MLLHFGTLHNKKQRNDKRKAQRKGKREQEKEEKNNRQNGKAKSVRAAWAGPGQRLIKAVKNCEKLLKRFSQGREKEQEKKRRVST